jgi:hypothetical protein
MNYSDLRRRTIRDTTQKMEPARKMGTVLIAEKIIMWRLSIAAMAFGLLLAEGLHVAADGRASARVQWRGPERMRTG